MSEQIPPMHDPASTHVVAEGRATSRSMFGEAIQAWLRTARIDLVLLGFVLLFGGYLRFTHNNWDASSGPWAPSSVVAQSGHLHPDERFLTQISVDTKPPSSVANYFDTDTSPLNPYNIDHGNGQKQPTFVYGTLPLFMNKLVASHLHVLSLGQADNWNNYDHYNRSGRLLSALFDTTTILLIFLLGRQLMNRNVGLLAAFLYALSAFPIQNAHFFVVDPFVTFFATFTILFAVRAAQRGGSHNFAIAGMGAGLAAACKITAISLFPVVVLGIGVFAWRGIGPFVAPIWSGDTPTYRAARDGRRLDASIVILLGGSLVALAAGFIAFRIAMPYAFKSPSFGDLFVPRSSSVWKFPFFYPDIMNHAWLKDQADQRGLLDGSAFPPNVQWIGRSKWIWPAQQMISWGMGPALGITAWLGLVFVGIRAIRKRDGVWLVPLAWILGYFGFMGMQFSLYMRYFLPLYPTLTVFAAVLLYQTWRWAASDRPFAELGHLGDRVSGLKPAVSIAARAGVAAVLVLTLLMGLAFYNIYRSPVTRVVASKWIVENVPAGSVIGHEHWDDSVPYSVAGVPPVNYGSVEFDNFNGDSPQRVSHLLDLLDEADYIAPSSRRLSGTIPRVPGEWPVTSRYYQALESGELGFEKVADFTSYPRLFGIKLDDTGAEESYSVYDHPEVIVYKKTADYSRAHAVQVLHADAYIEMPPMTPKNAGQNGLLFRPAVLATQQGGGTWSDIFDPGDFANAHPLFVWLVVMELAAFALVPLAIVGFRGLPDRGYLLTKPLGILALAYATYGPASFGIVDFTRGEIAGALAFLVAIGIVTGALWRTEIRGWVREHWRFILLAEGVFLLMFVAAYWVRLQNPDLWHPSQGGEKPMDFAYLNGVIRSTDLSQGPIDPWYAGGYLNYYWFGQFIGATVTKLTGIVPEVAYNLIVPMFFALAASATFSVTYNLTEATRRLMRRRPGRLPIGPSGPIIAGLGAIFLVLVAGNLAAVDVLATNLSRVSPWQSDLPLFGNLITIVGGFKAIIFGDASLHQVVVTYDWWAPSRALSVQSPGKEVAPITEFPFWTFLFADLHAHLMAIPFAMTATGVALGAVLNFTRLNPVGAAREHVRAREISSWAMVAVLALIIGALRWINSWDYPPFLLMGAAGLLIAERAKDGRFTVRTLTIGTVKALVMGVLSYVFFAEFAKNYSQAYNGFHQSDQTTALRDYLSHFGILLFLVTGLLLFSLHRAITRTNFVRSIFFGRARRRKALETMPVMAALAVAGGIIIYAGAMQRWGVTALAVVGLIAVVLVAIRELRSPSPMAPVLLFVYAMIALGLGLSGGVEVLTLDGDIGRMNTVFKFYLHVWMMWGVVGAFSLWYLFAVMRPQEAFLRRAGRLNAAIVRTPRYVFAMFVVLLLALALVYPYFGMRARIRDRMNPAQGTGNDGLAFLDKAGPYVNLDPQTGRGGEHVLKYTRDGINWIRANVTGSPTTFEAIGPSYRSLGSRVSIYTGLPTILGYDFHQSQQRAKFAVSVDTRRRDVAEFYSTEDVGRARELIRKYDVQYVIVGDEEQFNYPASGLRKFESGLGGTLELAYENPGMQVWHVIPPDQLGG
jgi:YYY domain-containing protein